MPAQRCAQGAGRVRIKVRQEEGSDAQEPAGKEQENYPWTKNATAMRSATSSRGRRECRFASRAISGNRM
jgi:hypothetical protein